jgi:hypothetical protein
MRKQNAAPAVIAVTPPQRSLLPPRVVIELDQAAERFVQTLFDGMSDTVLRRYPDEGQLAFSRGINAYVMAMAPLRRELRAGSVLVLGRQHPVQDRFELSDAEGLRQKRVSAESFGDVEHAGALFRDRA